MLGKLISLAIAVPFLVWVYLYGDERSFERLALWTAVAVVLIWVGRPTGCYRGPDGKMRTLMVTEASPRWLVGAAGWMILLFLVVSTLIYVVVTPP